MPTAPRPAGREAATRRWSGARAGDGGAPGRHGRRPADGAGRRRSSSGSSSAALATTEQEHQRLAKPIALAVFSSDAISSTAYATEEILFVTGVGGRPRARPRHARPDRDRGRVLLAIVVTCYRQTIFAYPSGGGCYIVSRENLGENPSLVAGASLLVDYILTVAVSISAGVAAIVSIPRSTASATHRVELCGSASSCSSASPTCAASRSRAALRGPDLPLHRHAHGARRPSACQELFGGSATSSRSVRPRAAEGASLQAGGTLGLFLILKGFSSGAVALTGVEAISNGVPAFRRPESKNAATTLVWMAVILGTLFFGVSVLAHRLQPVPEPRRTVIAQMGGGLRRGLVSCGPAVRDRRDPDLAANTAYADFPRCRRSSPATATSPASSPTAATGWCSRTASSCSPACAAR